MKMKMKKKKKKRTYLLCRLLRILVMSSSYGVFGAGCF